MKKRQTKETSRPISVTVMNSEKVIVAFTYPCAVVSRPAVWLITLVVNVVWQARGEVGLTPAFALAGFAANPGTIVLLAMAATTLSITTSA